LRGLNEQVIPTIGKIKIILIINNNELEFHVVKSTFPIPKDSILGQDFLIENKL